jgi:hypothetical protein
MMRRPACWSLGTAIALCLLAANAAAQQKTLELQTILDRAADYVALYEDRQLGNVLASETYVQSASYFSAIGNPLQRQQRRTDSDFLIVLIGTDRMGIRRVNRVNGDAVKSAEMSLEALMDDSPQGIRNRVAALREESARYNIGPVLRQINLPTFALKVVRREQAPRFSFVQHGTGRVNGIQGVEVRFQEMRSPTLVHGAGGESLISMGTLWIEPATGRVLKTEFNVENPYAKARGRVTVTYSANKTLGILVPEEMNEHYESDGGIVDCTASYSKFRSFNVDLKSDIQAPAKR